MLSLLRDHVSDAAAPFIFVILFLVIVGAALWLTPRLAKYYDGMLTEDPNAQEKGEGDADDGKAD